MNREDLLNTILNYFKQKGMLSDLEKGQNIFDIKEFDYTSFREAFKLVFDKEGYIGHYNKMMR